MPSIPQAFRSFRSDLYYLQEFNEDRPKRAQFTGGTALGPGVYSASNRNEYQKHKSNNVSRE
jgi:hypothetical protein